MTSRAKPPIPGVRWTEHEVGVAVLSFEIDTAFGHVEPAAGGKKRQVLTPAQQRVAALAVQGWSNAEIASELNIKLRTVANHMAAILAKTGASSRVDLARRFRG